MDLPAIADPSVRRAVRLMYVGSGLLFLATISLGIANGVMEAVSRAQVLAHFHAGTIGWVTLSVIATAMWAFSGPRALSPATGTYSMVLAGAGTAMVAGYVFAFASAFNGGPMWLLPLFGIPTAFVIWGGLGFVAIHWKAEPRGGPHWLLAGALIVASVGALMGVLVGIGYATGSFSVAVGAHAGPMDMYIALAFAGIVEAFLLPSVAARWPAKVQAVVFTLSGLITAGALLAGMPQLAPVAFLLFLTGFGFYMVRVGWRTFTQPSAPGLFWGGLFLPVYVLLFTALVFMYFIPEKPLPHALEVSFMHITFIGMATNLVFTVQIGQLGPIDGVQRMGIWLTNIGLLAFIAGEFMAERPDGAYLMAIGLLVVLARTMPAMWRGARAT